MVKMLLLRQIIENTILGKTWRKRLMRYSVTVTDDSFYIGTRNDVTACMVF